MDTASVEVKCECNIPFRSELIGFIQKLSDDIEKPNELREVPHKDAIISALKSKMLFIRLHFSDPVKKLRPRVVTGIRRILKKEFVGTIRVGQDDITLILI